VRVAALSVAAGLAFTAVVGWLRGAEPAQQYLSAYLIELSLSVDNLFVFALVFARFGIEPARQRPLLFWGLLGAAVLRTAFLAAGLGLIARFAWLIPAFGLFILVSGARLGLTAHGSKPDAGGRVAGFLERRVPAALAAVLALEAADMVFALDSLPAVMGVTHDLAIAVTSNLLALLGLRSLYAVLTSLLHRMRYLRHALAAILCLIGAKMAAEPWFPLPTRFTLGAIALILAACAWASLAPESKKRGPGP
jgi:tellurite resistance protein TerC